MVGNAGQLDLSLLSSARFRASHATAASLLVRLFVGWGSAEVCPERSNNSTWREPHGARRLVAVRPAQCAALSLSFDSRSAGMARDSQFRSRLGQASLGQPQFRTAGQAAQRTMVGHAERSIRNRKPFWITWPFLLACAAAGLSGSAVGYRWRHKQHKRANMAFPNLAEWRLAAFSPEGQSLVGGTLDSRYRLNRLIARGGFATVFDGCDSEAKNRRCAVKIFRRELSDKDWLKRHFDREVAALEQVHHPNVVQIFGHGNTANGSPYLVMEFIEGQTLRELLVSGPLSARYSALLLRQAGAALEAIHACGIWHRDLKPENLMIRSAPPVEESLVVIDFSIAIVRKPDETIHGLSRAAGTIYYMAPEQAIGYADAATDIYSLAKVLLEMLTGTRLSELLLDASMDLPERVRELLMTLTVRFSKRSIDLISSALEFDPAKRPRNVRDFANTVAEDLEGG